MLWTTADVDCEVRGENQQEREVKHENKVSALAEAKRLNKNDKKTLAAPRARQSQLFATVPAADGQCLVATASFTTGLGNEHPLENGFVFLNPYGLPYLPGSGVKGVLRQAARELAGGDWGDAVAGAAWTARSGLGAPGRMASGSKADLRKKGSRRIQRRDLLVGQVQKHA